MKIKPWFWAAFTQSDLCHVYAMNFSLMLLSQTKIEQQEFFGHDREEEKISLLPYYRPVFCINPDWIADWWHVLTLLNLRNIFIVQNLHHIILNTVCNGIRQDFMGIMLYCRKSNGIRRNGDYSESIVLIVGNNIYWQY